MKPHPFWQCSAWAVNSSARSCGLWSELLFCKALEVSTAIIHSLPPHPNPLLNSSSGKKGTSSVGTHSLGSRAVWNQGFWPEPMLISWWAQRSLHLQSSNRSCADILGSLESPLHMHAQMKRSVTMLSPSYSFPLVYLWSEMVCFHEVFFDELEFYNRKHSFRKFLRSCSLHLVPHFPSYSNHIHMGQWSWLSDERRS